jgi:hypothetical protein
MAEAQLDKTVRAPREEVLATPAALASANPLFSRQITASPEIDGIHEDVFNVVAQSLPLSHSLCFPFVPSISLWVKRNPTLVGNFREPGPPSVVAFLLAPLGVRLAFRVRVGGLGGRTVTDASVLHLPSPLLLPQLALSHSKGSYLPQSGQQTQHGRFLECR